MESFLNRGRPLLTLMLKAREEKPLLDEIAHGAAAGADAYCLQMETLRREDRARLCLTRLFAAMGEKPAYVTDYRRGNVCPYTQSDDELADELRLAASCGARLIDVRGDMFEPTPGELTLNEAAVKKQECFIEALHAAGAEVLMSSHVLRYIPAEEVVCIAREQRRRGADICKIVTTADTEAELHENLRGLGLLRDAVDVPTLFLCNGALCRRHRMLGPLLGACMALVVLPDVPVGAQPRIDDMRAMISLCGM